MMQSNVRQLVTPPRPHRPSASLLYETPVMRVFFIDPLGHQRQLTVSSSACLLDPERAMDLLAGAVIASGSKVTSIQHLASISLEISHV